MKPKFNFYTIGVYGFNESEFFNKLIAYRIDTFIDVRRRRGVRGAKYSFVNSKSLQKKLKELNIHYEHILALAPTNEMREIQKSTDKKRGVLKRERKFLSNEFRENFKEEILDKFDFNNLIECLKEIGAKNIVFFCVEREPLACHRSMIVERLKELYNIDYMHL
jgi:uncharacterized protein (DUF488 family)